MNTKLWLLTAGVVALTLILFVVWADPTTGPKVDTAYMGRWVVAREAAGLTEYLTWVDVSTTLVPDYRQEWTIFVIDAWRYGDQADAEADAILSQGEARHLEGAS